MKCLFVLVFLLSFVSPCSTAVAQWSLSEVTNRLAQEHAKVVTYRLIVEQKHVDDASKKRFPHCKWIKEFSAIGDHKLLAIIQFKSNGDINSWSLNGYSDECSIAGSNESGISINKTIPNQEKKLPHHLDWRIIGIGFCGDISSDFETVASQLKGWDAGVAPGDFVQNDAGLRYKAGGAFFKAEIKDGFRLTSFGSGVRPTDGAGAFDRNFSEWGVEYKSKFGLKLPVSATLQCGKEKGQYTLDWELVNDPIETGKKSVNRFLKVFPGNVKVFDRS